ncbi:MAG: DUF934 domain-containing protein [Halioglobus sp.]
MPKLIKNGEIIADSWAAVDPEASSVPSGQICSLDQWLALADKSNSAVQLEPDQPPAPLLAHLDEIALVSINFQAFMDGRGFSYGRELRERGYAGELRAAGHFVQDQLTYLQRVGFDAFAPADDSDLEGALSQLGLFTEFYQASIDQAQPLFRRR